MLKSQRRFFTNLRIIGGVDGGLRPANGIDVDDRGLEPGSLGCGVREELDPQEVGGRGHGVRNRGSAIAADQRRKRPEAITDL